MTGRQLVQFGVVRSLPPGEGHFARKLVPPGLGAAAPFHHKMVNQFRIGAFPATPTQSGHALGKGHERAIDGLGQGLCR